MAAARAREAEAGVGANTVALAVALAATAGNSATAGASAAMAAAAEAAAATEDRVAKGGKWVAQAVEAPQPEFRSRCSRCRFRTRYTQRLPRRRRRSRPMRTDMLRRTSGCWGSKVAATGTARVVMGME